MIYLVSQLPKHPTKRYGKRRLDQIKYFVVHHSANDGDVYSAARYHVSKGWPGIGYTFWIDQDGEIYTTNDLDTICYGVANNNTRCLSICVQGNFDSKTPNEAQLKALKNLITHLNGLIGKRPVKVHRDFVATGCPGNMLYDWVSTTYPSPQPLTIKLSFFSRLWNKWFKTDPDHPELI